MNGHGPKSRTRSVNPGSGLTTHMSSIVRHKSRLPSYAITKLITWGLISVMFLDVCVPISIRVGILFTMWTSFLNYLSYV